MSKLIFVATCLIAAAYASAHCSLHGDSHVLMSDGSTKYHHHASGLFRAFATAVGTKQLEVQCEFTDRTMNLVGQPTSTSSSGITDPEMSSCRMKVFDSAFNCGVDIRHGGVQNRGVGFIHGQQMALSSMSNAGISPYLGVNIIPLTDNALSVEVNWNGTFIQVVMGERVLQVHAPSITMCNGLCGTCSGAQQAPTTVVSATSYVQNFVIQQGSDIQPTMQCNNALIGQNMVQNPLANTLGQVANRPLLFPSNGLGNLNGLQSGMISAYPYPMYVAPTVQDMAYYPQFQSQALLAQVFAECSNKDNTRLQYDPMFNSFVEDCMYDKSFGPGFEVSAKASLDAFVTWTESLHRMNRAAQALIANPTMTICAACIPVQWTAPVSSALVLNPSVTTRTVRSMNSGVAFNLRYTGQNPYLLQSVLSAQINGMLGSNPNQNSMWNSGIVLPLMTNMGLNPLPSQMQVSPIAIGSNSQPIDSSMLPGMNMNQLYFGQNQLNQNGLFQQPNQLLQNGLQQNMLNQNGLLQQPNQLLQNGLQQNMLNQNGLQQPNQLLQNGLQQNMLNQNGLLQPNQFLQNGLQQNILNQNGLLQQPNQLNGLQNNMMNQNGLLQNQLNQNGLLQNNLLNQNGLLQQNGLNLNNGALNQAQMLQQQQLNQARMFTF